MRDSTSTIAAQIAQVVLATQKRADSNVELIERGLPSDLSVSILYPHERSVRTRSPECERKDVRCNQAAPLRRPARR